MPKKKAFDARKLVKMVKDETHQQEIMKAFSFKTAAQVKAAYFRALVESGEVPGIIGGRGTGKAKKAKPIGVGKRGSIIISAEKVAELGIGKDAKFTIRKTSAGIALKKV
jgi:ABC-type transporter Mla maintaining outer membrane lipid asymmetry ATPase subunit MlaF